jgi:hypothetical protein
MGKIKKHSLQQTIADIHTILTTVSHFQYYYVHSMLIMLFKNILLTISDIYWARLLVRYFTKTRKQECKLHFLFIIIYSYLFLEIQFTD